MGRLPDCSKIKAVKIDKVVIMVVSRKLRYKTLLNHALNLFDRANTLYGMDRARHALCQGQHALNILGPCP